MNALRLSLVAILLCAISHSLMYAETFVPGTGIRLGDVGDNFEDPQWSYEYNGQKSSVDIDGQARDPVGVSANGRWMESRFRGHPDIVERVATPLGGVAGSTGSLRMQTRDSGVPSSPSGEVQQEDFLANVDNRLGQTLRAQDQPSVLTRVFIPEFDLWEDRTGPSFGLRSTVIGHKPESPQTSQQLFPAIFLDFRSSSDPEHDSDFASLRIRSDDDGNDFYPGVDIRNPGWWTLGMSFSSNGEFHYYASEGVDDLTPLDHVASQFPGNFRFDEFRFFYYNVVNLDDGATWSTDWVVDDAFVFVNVVPEPTATVFLALVGATCSTIRRRPRNRFECHRIGPSGKKKVLTRMARA